MPFLLNARIPGPIPDIFDFEAFLTLPLPINSMGCSIWFQNAFNYKLEQINEENTNATLDCQDYGGLHPIDLDVRTPLAALYPYTKEEFEELVFSEPYCVEVGPLPLFLQRKVLWSHMQNTNKDKVNKEKGNKPIQGSMVLSRPSTHIPGQQPVVTIPEVILHFYC